MAVAPIAVTAGDAIDAEVGVEWVLDGSGSTDPSGGTITSYTWTLAAAPPTSVATISFANTANAKFTPDVAGTYRFFLVVTATGSGTSVTNPDSAPDSAFCNISVPTAKGFIIPADGQRDWGTHLYNILTTIDGFASTAPDLEAVLDAGDVAGIGQNVTVDRVTHRKAATFQRLSEAPGGAREIWAADGTSSEWDEHVYWTRSVGSHTNLIRPEGSYSPFPCASIVAVGDLVYIDGTGTIQQAQADAEATSQVAGVCVEKKGATECYVMTGGTGTCSGTGTTGERVWLSATTPGEMTITPPSTTGQFIAPVGISVGSGRLILQVWPTVEIT